MNGNKFLIIALHIMPILVGCIKTTDIKIEDKKMLAVLGEVSSSDSVVVHLFEAQSIKDTNTNWKPFHAMNVTLMNSRGEKITTLINRGNSKWSSPCIPVNEKSLTLKIATENESWDIATIIPTQFLATITNKQELSENNTAITLQINNTGNEHKHYVIEYLQNKSPASMELIEMESDDASIDNNIYKELGNAFYRIFLHTANNQTTVKLKLSKISAGQSYMLRIKSVAEPYYRYLYKYEIQKDRQNINTPFISLSPNYLGVWGSYVKNDIIIAL